MQVANNHKRKSRLPTRNRNRVPSVDESLKRLVVEAERTRPSPSLKRNGPNLNRFGFEVFVGEYAKHYVPGYGARATRLDSKNLNNDLTGSPCGYAVLETEFSLASIGGSEDCAPSVVQDRSRSMLGSIREVRKKEDRKS